MSDSRPCPACGAAFHVEACEGHYGRKVEVDLCQRCNALWFDDLEHIALSASGLLHLLRSIQLASGTERLPLPDMLKCPECAGVLQRGLRRTKDTEYTVYDCAANHGHFITLHEFLREKECIRPLKGEKLAELRRAVAVATCSGCGAPVNIRESTHCDHCGAPFSLLDPDAFKETLERLSAEKVRHDNPDEVTLSANMMFSKLETDRTFRADDNLGEDLMSQTLNMILSFFRV